MNTLAKFLTALSLLAALPVNANSQETGNIAQGYGLARDVCAVCHAIDDDYLVSPNPLATPFETVANMPEMTPLALSVWFQSPHPTMPNLILTKDETSNVIAYIRSLRD